MSAAQRALSAMIWDFLGKGGLAFVRFFESILLVRLLGNTDYGTLSVVLNFQATLVLGASLGLEGMLSRFLPEFQVKGQTSLIPTLIRQSVFIRSGVLLLVSGLCFGFSGPLVKVIFEETSTEAQTLQSFLQIVSFLVLTVGIQDLFRRVLVIHYKQRLINIVEFVIFSLYLAGAVFAIEQGWGITGVLLVNIGSKLLGLLIFALRHPSYFIGHSSLPTIDRARLKKIYPFAFSFYLYALTLHLLGKGGDIFILGAFLADRDEVAFYTIAFNFAFFSTSFFELALQGGFVLPFITETVQKGDPVKVRKVYTGLFEFVYLFTIPISIGGILLGADLIELFYGSGKEGVVPLLYLFFIHFCVVKIGIMNSGFMLASDQHNKLIASRVFFGIFNIAINLWLVGKYQALGVVWGTLITGVLASLYETWCVHHLVRPQYSWGFLAKVTLASIAMGGFIWVLEPWLQLALPLRVALLITVGGVVYAAMVIKLKPIASDNIEVLRQSKLPYKKYLFRLLSSAK